MAGVLLYFLSHVHKCEGTPKVKERVGKWMKDREIDGRVKERREEKEIEIEDLYLEIW